MVSGVTVSNDFDFNGKSIMITGGTGSFGHGFVGSVLKRYKPKKLIIYSRDELKQYEMEQTYRQKEYEAVRYFLGDVRDLDRLSLAMRGVDVVVHAAAMKHVAAAEYNPMECVKTNIVGADNVVSAAIHNGVKRVLALSTDKAANPLNLYGATKLASDKIFISANALSGKGGTQFSVVRYGNVIASRGSVIPLFMKLVDQGAASIPITDERMTRFWITLQQGVDFVFSCLGIMQGGEVFVPKIPSMRIVDIAQAIAPSVPIKIIGIQPGEKLHELMISADDSRNTLELPDRYIIEPLLSSSTYVSYLGKGAVYVKEGFSYSSDNNADWLDRERLLRMVNEI